MIRRNMLPLLIIFILTGCAANPPISTPSPASLTPTLPATNAPTVTPTPAPVLTTTPETRFTRQCLDVEQNDVTLKDLTSGTVILSFDLVDVQSGKKHKLSAQHPESKFYGYGNVSPDGTMYAYIEDVMSDQLKIINIILWVVDANAKVLSKISLNRVDLLAPRWLNNENLIFDTSEYGHALLVMNPFTRKQRDIANELPLLNTVPVPGGPWWRVEYSPDLEWVVYAYRDEANRKGLNTPEGTIVRDVVKQQNLWQLKHGNESGPAWSPDGKEVAVVGNGQLYLINRSGQAKPVLDETGDMRASSPSWSPDDRRIAFWNFDSLIVYDTQTNQGIDVCIKNDEGVKPSPHWLPNNEQLSLDGYFESDMAPGNYRLIIDIQKNTANKIRDLPDDSYPMWMNSLP